MKNLFLYAIQEEGGGPIKIGLAENVSKRISGSRKPDEQYDYCRRMSPSAVRFVELFARQQHPGWGSWGNQTDKFEAAA